MFFNESKQTKPNLLPDVLMIIFLGRAGRERKKNQAEMIYSPAEWSKCVQPVGRVTRLAAAPALPQDGSERAVCQGRGGRHHWIVSPSRGQLPWWGRVIWMCCAFWAGAVIHICGRPETVDQPRGRAEGKGDGERHMGREWERWGPKDEATSGPQAKYRQWLWNPGAIGQERAGFWEVGPGERWPQASGETLILRALTDQLFI